MLIKTLKVNAALQSAADFVVVESIGYRSDQLHRDMSYKVHVLLFKVTLPPLPHIVFLLLSHGLAFGLVDGDVFIRRRGHR